MKIKDIINENSLDDDDWFDVAEPDPEYIKSLQKTIRDVVEKNYTSVYDILESDVGMSQEEISRFAMELIPSNTQLDLTKPYKLIDHIAELLVKNEERSEFVRDFMGDPVAAIQSYATTEEKISDEIEDNFDYENDDGDPDYDPLAGNLGKTKLKDIR